MNKKVQCQRKEERDSGYTLLEYCAGAALIAGILWTALDAFGDQLVALLQALQDWTLNRTEGIDLNN